MKYLIEYPMRSAIAIGAVVMNLINIIRAIRTGEITEEMIVAFLLAVFTLLGLYYNMPTSIEGMAGLEEIKTLKECRNYEQEYVPDPDDDEEWEGDDDDNEC